MAVQNEAIAVTENDLFISHLCDQGLKRVQTAPAIRVIECRLASGQAVLEVQNLKFGFKFVRQNLHERIRGCVVDQDDLVESELFF